ncbi:MAG: hypothetical protein ACI97A_003282 [Planctomycetota bacterium]|jgi:hypothetical protein
MSTRHRGFWLDLLSKIGVPIFSATLVGCILKDEVRLLHYVLMGIGLALIYLAHRLEHHAE